MRIFEKFSLCLCLFLAIPLCAVDLAQESKDEEGSADTGEAQLIPADSEKPTKLKPGEEAVVITRTVKIIKVPDTEEDIRRRRWGCTGISDDSFILLKEKSPREQWEKRAAEFIVTFSGNCPHYKALANEFPAWLSNPKDTQLLAALYQLNSVTKRKKLLKIAREDEVNAHIKLPGQKSAKENSDQKVLEASQKKHHELVARALAARLLLPLKFKQEMNHLNEAHAIVKKFMREYVDSIGNVRTKNIRPLKTYLNNLTTEQKKSVRGYLQDALVGSEYPKLNLFSNKDPGSQAKTKTKRTFASLTKIENSRHVAIQVMLFAIE